MKRITVTVAIAATLLLTGCTAATEPQPAPSTSTAAAPAAEETVAPLAAETPAAATGDQQFLTYVRENLPSGTVIPNATDEQLLAAGQKACEIRATGAATDSISVIDGEQPSALGYYEDSAVIVGSAGLFLCG